MLQVSPGVSIIIPVYDAEVFLEACIESLLRLDYPAELHEIVCVDNGSTDRSPEILERFGSRIRVISEARRGASAARNQGVRNARFSVVAFTDSDCTVDPKWLRHLVEPLSDAEVGVSGGSILSREPRNTVEAFGETVHDNGKSIQWYKPPFVDSANWASRKETLDRVGGFDVNFLRAQDVELSCRLLQAGYRFAYVPEAIVYHRNESTWLGLFHEGFTHGKHSVALIERHRSFYESFGYRPVRLSQWRLLWVHFRDYVRGHDRDRAGCLLVFNTGKRLGRLAGSMQSGVLHL